VTLQDVANNIPITGTFVNYSVDVFAKGVNPGAPAMGFTNGGPLPLGFTQNRTDTLAFSTPGKYLVICSVRLHFIDGMYAWVRVVDDDNDDHRGHGDRDDR
jgi:hypothetical protein